MLIERYKILKLQMQLASQRDTDCDLMHFETELAWMLSVMTPQERREVESDAEQQLLAA
jgi:hypothetical protein